ncbi:ribose-phosphate pyrophosphokinase [Stemphylium lycopersici]|nr:ribose-phosphate pyrophosphokinase [Stemphylium lycopersici]
MPLPFNQESWIWYTCAVGMIGARLISRKILFRSIKGLQIDDWTMGLFVTAAYTVMIVLANRWLKTQSNLEPKNFDFKVLTSEELSRRIYGSKVVVVVEQMQIAVIWACKACLLVMYHRITRTALHTENFAIKVLAVYNALGFAVIEVLYFTAWCRPFSDYYAVPTNSQQCTTMVNHRITKAVFNISSDLLMLCIALQMLIRSLLPMKRKIILCGIFSLGLFVVAASVMNTYYSLSKPYNSTWIYWYVRESSTAILVANLPFTWTILREIFELGQFDENNPPPWTYHSARTAGGRKTAKLLHQTGTTVTQASTKRSPTNSDASKAARNMNLVASTITTERSKSRNSSNHSREAEEGLAGEAIQLHDFAPAVLRTADDGIITLDIESGLINEGAARLISPDHIRQRDKLASALPPVTQDGTGGFYIDDHPISPPSRARLAVRSIQRRDNGLVSMDRRTMSLASSRTTPPPPVFKMRNIVVLGGTSHPQLTELLITISACQTASAKRITAVLPLFPYSRQSDIPYNKTGAPLSKVPGRSRTGTTTCPQTPFPGQPESAGLTNGSASLHHQLSKMKLDERNGGASNPTSPIKTNGIKRTETLDSTKGEKVAYFNGDHGANGTNGMPAQTPGIPGALTRQPTVTKPPAFEPQVGYRQWVAQAGTLIADLLTCAGADHVITMDLHDPQYQGFFDIPVDNLYGRHLLRKYIQFNIPNYQQAVVVSPDAGGAKRATAIADALGMPFALIHKERRPTQISDRQNATMMLVGDVSERTTILVDDLADTSNTITRAAKLLKKEGATEVIALITHGILSGDAIDRINNSALDKVIVTNTVPQDQHKLRCPKLEVLEVGNVFAEAIRRVHHGESISVLFDYS